MRLALQGPRDQPLYNLKGNILQSRNYEYLLRNKGFEILKITHKIQFTMAKAWWIFWSTLLLLIFPTVDFSQKQRSRSRGFFVKKSNWFRFSSKHGVCWWQSKLCFVLKCHSERSQTGDISWIKFFGFPHTRIFVSVISKNFRSCVST
jgi:hypothetical protein